MKIIGVSLGLYVLSTLVLGGEESLLIHFVTLCSEQKALSGHADKKKNRGLCPHQKSIYPALSPSHC